MLGLAMLLKAFLEGPKTFIPSDRKTSDIPAKILSDIKENCEKLITCTELLSQVVVINGKNHDVISDIKANFSINVRHC